MGKMKNSILKCKFFILLNTLKSKFYFQFVRSLLCRYSLTSSFRVKMWSSLRMFSRSFILNICFSFTLSIWTMTGDIFKKPSENDPKTIFGWISDRRYKT